VFVVSLMSSTRASMDRHWWVTLSAGCAAASTLVLGGLAPDEVATMPAPESVKAHAHLIGVATLSRSDVWAVGYTEAATAGLILHWDGTAWSRELEQSPGRHGEEAFDGVSAESATDVWAVGSKTGDAGSGSGVGISEHWDGSTWTSVPVPAPAGAETYYLASVATIAPDDAWAVGAYDPTGTGDSSYPLVVHWNGARWRVIAVPHPGLSRYTDLLGVSAHGASDVWAVGYSGHLRKRISTPYVLHWDGTEWRRVSTPHTSGEVNNLVSVSTTGRTAWAVGYKTTQGSLAPFVEQYAHHIWREVMLPNKYRLLSLNSVSALSATDAWIAGFDQSGISKTAILGWNGHSWDRIASQDPNDQDALGGISAARPDLVWAVGTTYTKFVHPNALTELWDGHQWTVR
jgi:hypothetical protein